MITNSVLSFSLICMLTTMVNISSSDQWWTVVAVTVEYIPAFTLTPRFILSLRELDARVRRSRDGSDIDTAFGLTSTFYRGAVADAIMFADSGGTDSEEQGEEIQMEGGKIRSADGGA